MKLAYSYIRFSTLSQKHGRSYERQLQLCIDWCAKQEGLTLSDDRFLDEGRSGYSGEHLGEKGQLKRFLDLVQEGKIPRDSYLVIESLDRLSRQNVNEAMSLFLRILNAGIHIVTLMDNAKVYSPAMPAPDLIMSVLIMARANEESETKASRARDDWASKLAKARSEERKPVGKLAKWLDVKDGKYVPNQERCAIVERIFKECIAGRGFVSIAQGLNKDGIVAFRGGTWCSSSVDDLLKNRNVLGEWEPKDGKGVILNYFPQVIDNETWESAQLALEDRRFGKVTKQTPNFQVWQQVAHCGICSSTMNLLTKPKGATSKSPAFKYKYLACSNKRKGLCKESVNVRIEQSEEAFKELLVNVGALGLIQTDTAAIVDEIRTVDASILRQRQLLAQHEAAVSEVGATHMVYRLIGSAELEIVRLETVRAELERKHTSETQAQNDKAWLLANIPLTSRGERQRANALLRRLGVRVRVLGGEAVRYVVYQKEKLIFELRHHAGKLVADSYSTDVTERMFEQGVLQEHELEVNIKIKSKERSQPEGGTIGPDWSGYDEVLPDEAYEMLGLAGNEND